jgi:hypothetical protein
MGVKYEQRAAIEFLPLKECASEEIMACLRKQFDSPACCRASVFRWISEVDHGIEEFRNEGGPGISYQQKQMR